ncbi:glycine--tRNA ligase subunit beta, partial [Halomonas sp. BBD48]|nr:glycine--tRNA ligase subunit beta [Halomonas sp. BBD48]
MAANTLLVELGVEELPPGAIDSLSDSLASGIAAGLRNAEVEFGDVRAYATPRRLAVQIDDLADKQPDRQV